MGHRSPCFSSPHDQCNLVAMTTPARSPQTIDPNRDLLRHTLATLAYRGGKAVRDAPAGFSDFHGGEGLRTSGPILAHIGDLFDWALSIAMGRQKWQNSTPPPWEQEVTRFFRLIASRLRLQHSGLYSLSPAWQVSSCFNSGHGIEITPQCDRGPNVPESAPRPCKWLASGLV